MARLPLDPIYSKALIVAGQFNCLEEMLITVAMLSVESIFFAPREKLEEVCSNSNHSYLFCRVVRQWNYSASSLRNIMSTMISFATKGLWFILAKKSGLIGLETLAWQESNILWMNLNTSSASWSVMEVWVFVIIGTESLEMKLSWLLVWCRNFCSRDVSFVSACHFFLIIESLTFFLWWMWIILCVSVIYLLLC